jgi:hypothetical protein
MYDSHFIRGLGFSKMNFGGKLAQLGATKDFYLSTHEHYGMWRSHYWSHVLARLASERHISGLSIFLASGEHLIKIFMNVYKRKENLDPSMSRSSRLPSTNVCKTPQSHGNSNLN